MHITARMEMFNKAFIRALAASCGLNTSEPEVDNDSIDIEISAKYPAENGKVSRPRICVQLKATSTLEVKHGLVKFDLSRKNYQDLQINDSDPRYLFVLDLSQKCTSWIKHKRKFTAFKSHCYWVSLKNLDQIPDDQGTKRISIPISQRLTVFSLPLLLNAARTGDIYEQK